MKLILAIVSNEDANKVSKALIKQNFFTTKLATQGGFLSRKNTTFLIGTNDEKVIDVIEIIEAHSKTRSSTVPSTIANEFGMFSTMPVEVKIGGATIFILNVDQFVKV